MPIVFRTIDEDASEALQKAGFTVTPRFHNIAVDWDSSVTFHRIPGADEEEGFWLLTTGVILQAWHDDLSVSTQDAVDAALKERETNAAAWDVAHQKYLDEELQSLSILRGTFGCPSGDHAGIDPYWDTMKYPNWHDAARGDGRSYSGTLDTVLRLSEESFEDFMARAERRAGELDRELHCSRCYRS